MTRLTDWIGRTETATETLRPFPADALAATLDRDERYPEGAALPDLWHWLYFLPLHKLSESGRDGPAWSCCTSARGRRPSCRRRG